VENRFITDEKPARVMLLELQAKNSQLQQQLDAAERQLKAQGQPADPEDPGLSELQRQLTDARAENALLKRAQSTDDLPGADNEPLTRRIAELEQRLAAAAANPELEALQQTNRQLQQRLEQIARLAGAPETATPTANPAASEATAGRFQAWELPLLLLAMLVSFIGGVAFKNYRLAKRYGGFRV
jgi:hypothetical protein